MLMMDVATDKSSQSPLSLLPGKDEGDPKAFDKLLKGLTLSLGKGKSISTEGLTLLLSKEQALQETSMLPSAVPKLEQGKEKAVEKSLLNLLHGEDTDEESVSSSSDLQEIKTLNPKITSNMPPRQLNELIQDAKAYLKTEISRISDVKEMPKTLKGLVELAQKVGVDLTKVTLESVQVKNTGTMAVPTTEKSKGEAQQVVVEKRAGIKNIPTAQLIQQQTQTPEAKSTKHAEPLQTLLQKSTEPLKAATPTEQPARSVPLGQTVISDTKAEQSQAQTSAQLKSAVNTVAVASTDKRAVTKSKEEPVQRQSRSVTAQSAVDKNAALPQASIALDDGVSAEVMAKQSKQPLFSSALNTLVHGEKESSEMSLENSAKTVDTTPKSSTSMASITNSDQLENKMNEAKQTMRHFAGEIKEAIQNYKSPFTRIKIQLNPAKLGEVDVTMVQRGNNLHINISSNTTAITTLAQNATELKTQLSQNGMGSTTMNFSNSSNSEQQQQQQRQHIAELYEQFENSEEFELMESLELIIPKYV